MLEIFFYYRISPPPNLPLSENYTKTVQHKEGNNVIVKASGTKEKKNKNAEIFHNSCSIIM